MSIPASQVVRAALSPRDTPESSDRRTELAEIDASTSGTVLLFFVAGMVWLLIGTVFALLANDEKLAGSLRWVCVGAHSPIVEANTSQNISISNQTKIFYIFVLCEF